jgi:outer membrane receptor protein involved in Fe transport
VSAVSSADAAGAPPQVAVPDVTADVPRDETPVARAITHFKRGLTLYEEGDARAALAEFRKAYELAPHFAVLFNVGQVCVQLRDYACALDAFERYLEGGGREVPADRRAPVEARIATLRGRVARLAVTTSVVDVRIAIDDVPVGTTPLAGPLRVSVGQRKISAERDGYVPVTRYVDVASSEDVELAITMTSALPPPVVVTAPPPPPKPPMEVSVVTASKRAEPVRDSPATVYVVTEEQIVRFGLRDLRDVLRVVPGVEWSFDQLALSGGLRGFASNWSQTILMVNGREVQSLLAGEAFISFQFQTYNVKQVEVLMGPSSALYGSNGLVGVINVITKKDDPDLKDGGYLRESVGSFTTASTSVVYRKTFSDDARAYVSASWFGTKNEDLGDWLSDHASEWRSSTGTFLAPRYNPLFPYRNTAKSLFVEAEVEYRGLYAGALIINNESDGGIEQVRPAFGERALKREQYIWYAGYQRRLTSALSVKIEYQDFTENDLDTFTYHSPTAPANAPVDANAIGAQGFYGIDGAKRRRVEAQGEARLGADNVLVTGAVLEDWDLGTGPLSGPAPVLLPAADTNLMLVPDARYRQFRKLGLYAQDRHRFFGRLDVIAGVRLDAHSTLGTFVNPRVGMTSRLWRGATLRAIYGQAYREPSIFELSSTPPVSSAPTLLRAVETGFAQQIGAVTSSTSVFVDLVSDAIVPSPEVLGATGATGTSAFVRQNARSEGLEEELRLRGGPWEAFASYAYVQREDRTVAGVTTNALGLSRHKVIAGASYAFLAGKVFVSLYDVLNTGAQTLVEKADGSGTEVITLPDYQNLTATVGLRRMDLGGAKWQATATFDNLFDTVNLKPDYRGLDPRMYPQNRFNALVTLWLFL